MLLLHKTDVAGAILVFLPGYDEILAVRERIKAERRRLTMARNYKLFILHANSPVRGGILRTLVCIICIFFGTCDTLWDSDSLQVGQYGEQILVL